MKITSTYFRPGQIITEQTFDKIIYYIGNLYKPIIQSKGAILQIQNDWNDPTVNGFATRDIPGIYKMEMKGGLARHPLMTEDGLALAFCHEMGHQIGGYPKKSQASQTKWASSEGQSDYFAITKCLRKYFEKLKNSAQVVSRMFVPKAIQQKCFQTWALAKDHAICVRSALAGLGMANLITAVTNIRVRPNFETSVAAPVMTTNTMHSEPQCRLETYFQGALCTVSHLINFSDKNERIGACVDYHKNGARPKCWFKPLTEVI